MPFRPTERSPAQQWTFALSLALALGCAALEPKSDAGTPDDAGTSSDAGDTGDAGSPDGGNDAPSCANLTETELLADIRAFIELARDSQKRGDLAWGRISGEESGTKTADLVAARFNSLGLLNIQGKASVDTHRFHSTERRWVLTQLALSLQGDPYLFTTMSTFFESKPTTGLGLTGELVDVGTGATLPADLTGKIALLESTPGWSIASNGVDGAVLAQLVARNAAGVLIWANKPQAPDNLRYAYPVPAASAQKITWQLLGMKDGLHLKSALAAGPATVTLVVEGQVSTDWDSENVIGMLPGNGSSDEYVVLTAHTDSVFEGANDNASGLANMLALAKHFSHVPQAKRKRSIIFAATGSHHFGPGLGAITLAQWLPQQIPNFFSKCALVLNAEHLGSRNAASGDAEYPYTVGLTTAIGPVPRSELATRIATALSDESLTAIGGVGNSVKGDGEAVSAGSKRTAVVASIMELFYWYHTDQDTEANLDVSKIRRASLAACRIIDGLAGSGP